MVRRLILIHGGSAHHMHPKALAHHEEGLAFQEQGNLEAARDAFLQALEHDARLEVARAALMDVLWRLGDAPGVVQHGRVLLAEAPTHREASYLMGAALCRSGRYAEARSHLERAIQLDPGFVAPLEELLQLCRDQGDAAGELQTLQRLMASDPQQASHRFGFAEALARAGRATDAIGPLREALALDPTFARGYLLLSELESRQGHGEEAWRILQTLAGRMPEAPRLREALVALCRRQASDAGMAHHPDQAVRWWERLYALSPQDAQAIARLERHYEEAQRYGDLGRLCASQARSHPEAPVWRHKLLGCLEAQGRSDEALRLGRALLQEHPEDAEVRARVAQLALHGGDAAQAREILAQHPASAPLTQAALLQEALARGAQGMIEEAWDLLEPQLEDPAAREASLELARREALVARTPRARLRWCERAWRLDPRDRGALDFLVEAARAMGRHAQAARLLLAQGAAQDAAGWELRIACFIAAQLPEEAHVACLALAKLNGETPELLERQIELSLAARRAQRAWSEAERLAQRAPGSERSAAALGRVAAQIAQDHAKAGQFAEALSWYERHLSFSPASTLRKQMAEAQIATGAQEAAYQTYRRHLADHPEDLEVALFLGEQLLGEDRAAEAQGCFETILARHGDNLAALNGLARCLTLRGEEDAALQLFERTLHYEREVLAPLLETVRSHQAVGDHARAWILLEPVLRMNPQLPAPRERANVSLRELARHAPGELARPYWEALKDLGPDLEAAAALAMLEGRPRTGAEATALEAAQEALKLGDPRRAREILGSPGDAAELLVLGEALLEEGDPTRARACFARPELSGELQARCGLAACDVALGDVRAAHASLRDLPAEASEACREVAILAARKLAAWTVGGEGLELHEEILQWDPEDAEAHYALAALLLAQGSEVEATGHWLAILAKDPLAMRAALMASRLLDRGGLHDQAMQVLVPLVQAGEEEAVVAAARMARARGDRGAARATLEHGLAHGGAAALHAELARMAAEEADGELAWRHWAAVLEASAAAAWPSEAARSLLELADRLEPDATLPWLAEAAERLRDPELAMLLARVHGARHQPEKAVQVLEEALAQAPYQLEVALALGDHLVALGRSDRAREAYGIAAQGGSACALAALGRLARQEGDIGRAVAWFTRALAPPNEDAGLQLELAEVLFEGGQLAAARDQVAALKQLRPDHPRILRLEQLIQREQGRSGGPEALACWQALSQSDPTDLEAHRELARHAALAGDAALQREALERSLAHQGDDAPSQFALGQLFMQLGELEKAREWLQRAEAQGFAKARLALASVALEAQELEKAESWLAAAETSGVAAGDSGLVRVLLAQARQDPEAEWNALSQLYAVTGEGGYRDARLTLCRVQLARGDDLQRWTERGMGLDARPGELPSDAVARLGLLYQREGRLDDAERCLAWAAEAREPLAMASFARMARSIGNFAAAASWLVKALEIAPGDPELVCELAEVLLHEGEDADALELLRVRLREAGADPRACALARQALERLILQGAPDQVLAYQRELTRVAPGDPQVWRQLAQSADELGEASLAEEAREHLIELDPAELAGAEQLGRKRLEEGHRSACMLFERAASSGRASAYLGAAEAYARFQDPQRAAHWLHAHLVSGREDAATARLRYGIARSLHDPEGAWKALDDLERHLGPGDASCLRSLRLALCWEPLEQDMVPATWLDRALALAPAEIDLPAQALTAMGHRHRIAGKIPEARAAYAAAAMRDDAQAMAALARLERDAGALAEAIAWFERARAHQIDPALELEHARALMQADRHETACELLEPRLAGPGVVPATLQLYREALEALAARTLPLTAMGHHRAIARVFPDDPLPWRAIAKLAEGLNDAAVGIEARERLLAIVPDEAATVLELGRLYQAAGDPRARDLFARAARLGRVEGHVHLLELALSAGDQEMASRHLEELGRAAPDDPVHFEAQRALCHARGDVEGEWRALEALAARLSDESWPRSAMEQLARTHASGPSALTWLPRARLLAPQDASLIRRHAEALADAGMAEDALAAFREAYARGEATSRVIEALLVDAEAQADHAAAHDWLRQRLAMSGDRRDAERAARHACEAARRQPDDPSWWRRALEVAPEDPTAMRGLLHALLSQGAGEEAELWAQRLLEAVSGDPDACAVLAERAWERGDSEEARKAAEAVLARVPEHPEALLVRAQVAMTEGSPRAVLELQALRATYPAHPAIALAWAQHLARQQQSEEAYALAATLAGPRAGALAGELAVRLARRASDPLIWWRRALEHAPQQAEALTAVAQILLAQGKPDEALPFLFDLIRQQADPASLQLLAEALLQARRMPEARAMLQSLTLDFDHLPAWLTLGELQLAQGELEAARTAATRLLAADPAAAGFAARVAKALARARDPADDPEAARQAWLEVLRQDPLDAEAMFGIARALTALGELSEAIGRLTGLLAERPDWLDARALLAECHMLSGDGTRAEVLYQEVLAADPAHPMALMSLARAAQRRGEFVLAGDYCQRVLAVGPSSETARARLLAAYCARQLAEAARLRRDYEAAFLYADLVAAYQAPSFDLLRFQAELARDAGRDALALARYRRLLRTFPDAMDDALGFVRTFGDRQAARIILAELADEGILAAAYAMASLDGDEKDARRALASWQRALELAPDHPLILRRAADLCRREDRLEEACRYYRKLAEVSDYDPILLRTWGSTALSGGLHAEALEPFRRLAEDHDDRAAAFTVAQCHAALEAPADAYHWCQRVLEEGSNPEAEELAEASALLLAKEAKGNHALTWWRRYLELAAGDAEGWLELGKAASDLARWDEAIEAFERALELAPGSVEAVWQRAEALRRVDREAEARQALEEALQEHPRHAPTLFSLAELAWKAGELQTVWDLGQRLLGINNRNPAAMELIGRCAKVLAEDATARQDWDNAIVYWELLLSFSADEQEALEHLGEAYVRAERFAEAVGIHRELARIVGDRPTRFRGGEVAARGGFWDEAREVFTALRDEEPGDLACHQALAIVALGLGEPQAAAQHYREALAIAPDDLGSLYGLGRICVSEGLLQEAWEPLKRAATLSEGEADHEEYVALARHTAERLAEVASSKQRWDEAIAFDQEVVQLVEDPTSRRELGRVYYRAGRKAEAIGVLSDLLAGDPDDHDTACHMARIMRDSGDLAGARQLYQGVLETASAHFEARQAMAELGWEAGEFEVAWEHLQEALAVDPTDEAALALYRKLTMAFAEREEAEGNLATAVQWWQLCHQQDRGDLALLRRIAEAQVTLGHLGHAAETYARLLDADPKDLETAHILADIHRQRGDLRSAETPLLRIVALDPRHVPSLRALMVLARDRRNPQEAMRRAYDLLDVEPHHLDALRLLAWSHEQLMERRAALEVARDLIALDPQDADAHHLIARMARDLGDLDLAKQSAAKALYFQPQAPYYYTMGTIYMALGQPEEAMASYGQALVLDPDCADAHAELGRYYLREDRAEKARTHLQRARTLLPPDSVRAMELQGMLDLIG